MAARAISTLLVCTAALLESTAINNWHESQVVREPLRRDGVAQGPWPVTAAVERDRHVGQRQDAPTLTEREVAAAFSTATHHAARAPETHVRAGRSSSSASSGKAAAPATGRS